MPKFNREAYLACDGKAKSAIRSFLDTKGVYTNVFEDYGPDISSLQSLKGSWKKVWHEVEIKTSWKHEWPTHWRTIHIPYRKKKYLDEGRRVMFWVLNNPCTRAVFIHGDHLGEEYKEVIPNTRYPKGEYFYDIPIHLTKVIDLT